MGEYTHILWKTFLIYTLNAYLFYFVFEATFDRLGVIGPDMRLFDFYLVSAVLITGWFMGVFFYILPIAKNDMKKPFWLILETSFVLLLPAVCICYYLLRNNILIPNYQYSSTNTYSTSSSSSSSSSLPNTSKWTNRKNSKDEESEASNLVSQTYMPPTRQAEFKNINSLLNTKKVQKPCPHCGVALQSEFDKFCLSCNRMI